MISLTKLIRWPALPLWLTLAACTSLTYLAIARFGYGYTGFPLDDAWIHQTYARNLGLRGESKFTPGVASTGSTSPSPCIHSTVNSVYLSHF